MDTTFSTSLASTSDRRVGTYARRWAGQDRQRQLQLGHQAYLWSFELGRQVQGAIEIAPGKVSGVLRQDGQQAANAALITHVPLTVAQVVMVVTIEFSSRSNQFVQPGN